MARAKLQCPRPSDRDLPQRQRCARRSAHGPAAGQRRHPRGRPRSSGALPRPIPSPRANLNLPNPLRLWVPVVVSAQATDAGVNKATEPLFKVAHTPQKMLELGEEGLQERIKTIGLYRNKAKNVIGLSRALIAEHRGEVPRLREALEALPGVGRKTANVVLNTAFGEPTLAVDTHVFRVAHRLGRSSGNTPLHGETGLLKVIPERYLEHANHWLILHGRYVCQARRPRCDACVVCDLCTSRDKWFDCGPPKVAAQRKA